MSRKKIDIMQIISALDIEYLRKIDFSNQGVPKCLLDYGELEDVLSELVDYIMIFRELRMNDVCRDNSIIYVKMFDLIYPLILLAYKKFLKEFEEKCFLKNENEKLKEEVKSRGITK